MSLINDFIKDIQKRLGKTPEGTAPVSDSRFNSAWEWFQLNFSARFRLILLVLLVLLLVLTLSGLWSGKDDAKKRHGPRTLSFSDNAKENASLPAALKNHPLPKNVTDQIVFEEDKMATTVEDETVKESPAEEESSEALSGNESTPESTQADQAPDEEAVETNDELTVEETTPTEDTLAKPAQTFEKKHVGTVSSQDEAPVEQAVKVVPQTPEERATALYDEALQAISDHDIAKAIWKMRVVTQAYPDFMPAQVAYIKLLIANNQMSLALTKASSALDRYPTNAGLRELKARILFTQGAYTQALSLLEEESPLFKENPDYYSLLALVQQKLGNDLYAISIFRRLILTDPGNARWWLGLAISYDNLSQKNAAIEAYHKSLALGELPASLQFYAETRLNVLKD